MEVEDRGRCDHRRVSQSQRIRVELRVVVDASSVGRFRELHVSRLSRPADQAHVVQPADSLLHRNELPERLYVADVVAVGRIHQRGPGRLRGIVAWRDGDARVLVGVVGADDEAVALVVHRILVARAPGRDHDGSRLRVRRWYQPDL